MKLRWGSALQRVRVASNQGPVHVKLFLQKQLAVPVRFQARYRTNRPQVFRKIKRCGVTRPYHAFWNLRVKKSGFSPGRLNHSFCADSFSSGGATSLKKAGGV